MAAPLPVDTLAIAGRTFPVVQLLDRRPAQPQQRRWVFAKCLEELLFDQRDRSRGGLHVLLERLSIASGCLTVDKAAVQAHKLLTQTEKEQLYASPIPSLAQAPTLPMRTRVWRSPHAAG